jgi:RNA polymerase sigma factor (sigma-70 family)
MGQNRGQEEALAVLMRAAQAGNKGAYSQLLHSLVPLMKDVVRERYRFLQTQDIDDVVQDILLSVHVARAAYDPARPFLPWLMAIARHRMADSARRYARRAAHEIGTDKPPETFPAGETNVSASGYGDTRALAKALSKLPRSQREAVELTKLREMSLKEASAATGSSVGALKVSVHRGLSALRKALGGTN